MKKIAVMAVLHDSGFNMELRYMAYCCSSDVDWPRCTSSWFPQDFKMGEVPYFPSCSASSNHLQNADGEPSIDLIVPVSSVLFVPGYITPLLTIQAPLRR